MRRRLVTVAIAGSLAGCASRPPEVAPATFGLRGDAAFAPSVDGVGKNDIHIGGQLGAEVGFESTGCCGLGVYVARTSIKSDGIANRNPRQVTDITEGGIALTIVTPKAEFLRFRIRAGVAGEPPELPKLGRTGYVGNAAALFRIFPVVGPARKAAMPAFDLFVGYSMWTFGRDRTTGGELGDKTTLSAVLVGLRMGAEYGVDLQ